MTAQEVKKRKACNACTMAKAKCSPLESRPDICQRCERLDKECVYGDSLRKRGSRTRSRMKQLEERIEALMDVLSGDTNPPGQQASRDDTTIHTRLNEKHNITTSTETLPSSSVIDGVHKLPAVSPFTIYDPIERGHLNEDEAANLLKEFREEYPQYFPFVIFSASISSKDLRRQQPFLFSSIMSVMTYRTPAIQSKIAEDFRNQIAVRIVQCSYNGLEILQGLLIHTAYYHYFYQTGKQQMSLMVQLCVAAAQELRTTKKFSDHELSSSAPLSPTAEDRALLGTYHLAAAFSQTWRKRTTVPYTKAIARACEACSQSPEQPSDLLIAPLVRYSELMCRINDYFSYDEIEDSDIIGEKILEVSVRNFNAERRRLRDAIPESLSYNVTLRLAGHMLDVMIYECSFHSILWQQSSVITYTGMPSSRTNMLQKSILASESFIRIVLGVPPSLLHHFAFPVWSGWFYSTLLAVKTLLLRKTGTIDTSCVNKLPHAVGEYVPREKDGSATEDVCKMTSTLAQTSLDNAGTTIEELELVSIFESFIGKLKTVAPRNDSTNGGSTGKSFLAKVVTLQTGLLLGVKKVVDPAQSFNTMGTIDFDFSADQSLPDDWLWDTVMNDASMFPLSSADSLF